RADCNTRRRSADDLAFSPSPRLRGSGCGRPNPRDECGDATHPARSGTRVYPSSATQLTWRKSETSDLRYSGLPEFRHPIDLAQVGNIRLALLGYTRVAPPN